ncbi:E3 ubiquitin/ISG15 ligase TRIM25 isoform X1 [Podarcis raffonei]|uniref:E3 ubiquitin/ISG15 ligase TRIM25 isoform X1 n=1 Tax=Podarcis raffonei TaxID=65483 RepID=UPI00232982B1|nr:E3 ubiquitin/ISG15 ligase TRIM25 isoform X1 [Podarcis raffonei]
MAQLLRAPSAPSLVGLEEELTCSICLCVFESPVTTPCGHNFCLPCLEMTWSGLLRNFCCPQCRSSFDSRPELKKNTVLCRVVEQFQSAQGEPADKKKGLGDATTKTTTTTSSSTRSSVACDSCLEKVADKTCLTCMASFCPEHLRPHLESPAFKGHQLVPPVKDLQRRKCQTHQKLLEFYCKEHNSCICCFCLVTHKACATVPLQEAKDEKESQLKQRLTELYALNEKALQSLDQVRVQQKQTSDTANRKLDLLKAEFLEIIALIEEEEKEAVKKVLAEEKRVQDKYEYVYKVLGKKKTEIQGARDQIEVTLTEDDDITFLKKAAKLRQLPIKDVFIPKLELDQNLIHTVYQKAFGLKENVKQFLAQPQEKKKEGAAQWKPKPFVQPGGKIAAPSAPKRDDPPSTSSQEKKTEEDAAAAAADTKQRRRPAKRSQSPNQRARSSSRPQAGIPSITLESFLSKSREELLEFATKFTLDFNTAHKKVLLSERNTKISVSETPQNYAHHPQRFTYCSQVVAFQCFKRGIHYWEVELEHNTFCGVGVCYGSMARQGAESRLGRNGSSWCIEWFNSRISAWHNDVEKCLPNTKLKKIGVLLNYDGGFVIFFGVGEKLILLYKFRAQFTEALYPAFWVFSSGTTISLCQLK